MTSLRELYKCNTCANVLEVVFTDGAPLVCCGETITKMEAKSEDTGNEKHVPVVEAHPDGGIRVKVGSVEHPMEEKHYIAFIEVLTKDRVLRAELKPGQKPEAMFCCDLDQVVEVREYCNIHGLWKNK
jgi:superoxide reductase